MKVKQARVGVDVHGQIDRAMPHRRLSGPRVDAPLAEKCTERVPERMNIDGPAAVIFLRNPRRFQVAVKATNQLDRNGEYRRVGRQPQRDWPPRRPGLLLRGPELVTQPSAKV